MSGEDEICLWCQDALAGHGPVIELTTNDFKYMFKHDAKCKKIHRDCFLDYQQKRAKNISEDEQKRAHGLSEPVFNHITGHIIIRVHPAWFRDIIEVLSFRNATVHLGIRRFSSETSVFRERHHYCTSHRRQPIQGSNGMGRQYNRSNTAVFRRTPPQMHQTNTAVFRRTHPQMHQTLPTPMQYSRQPSPPHFTRNPSPMHVQFQRQTLQPSTEQLYQAQGTRPQPTQAFQNRFSPYTSPQGYFNGHAANPGQIAGNNNYIPERQNIYSHPHPFHHNPNMFGTWRRYSLFTQSHNRPGHPSVFQEHMHCQW